MTADLHRADCSPPSGCRRCGKPPRGRFTFYCGAECRDAFEGDHWWSAARLVALGYTPTGGGYYSPKDALPCAQADDTCSVGDMEINHIVPVDGEREDWSCQNHQSNLEPLCHSHHVRETKAQRRDGRIGTPETAARIRRNDAIRENRALVRDEHEAKNPRLL